MRRAVAVLVLALLGGLVALAGPAYAHAAYKSSEPADRSSVSSPPSRVTAEFTEPLADGSYLQVTDPCGSRVDGGDVSIVGYEMSVSMSGSRSGTYTVFYKALSQLDPHVVEGTFTFNVTSGPACSSAAEEPPPSEGDAPDRSRATEQSSSEEPGAVFAQGNSGGGGGNASSTEARSERSGPAAGSSRPPGRPPTSAKVPNIAADGGTDEEQRSVYDGIPMGTFAVSLLLAAVIGAAGGKIYAGIMGPRA